MRLSQQRSRRIGIEYVHSHTTPKKTPYDRIIALEVAEAELVLSVNSYRTWDPLLADPGIHFAHGGGDQAVRHRLAPDGVVPSENAQTRFDRLSTRTTNGISPVTGVTENSRREPRPSGRG